MLPGAGLQKISSICCTNAHIFFPSYPALNKVQLYQMSKQARTGRTVAAVQFNLVNSIYCTDNSLQSLLLTFILHHSFYPISTGLDLSESTSSSSSSSEKLEGVSVAAREFWSYEELDCREKEARTSASCDSYVR